MAAAWIYRTAGYEPYPPLGRYLTCRAHRLNDRIKNLLAGKIAVCGD